MCFHESTCVMCSQVRQLLDGTTLGSPFSYRWRAQDRSSGGPVRPEGGSPAIAMPATDRQPRVAY
jgi:hypothetical protein